MLIYGLSRASTVTANVSKNGIGIFFFFENVKDILVIYSYF